MAHISSKGLRLGVDLISRPIALIDLKAIHSNLDKDI